MQKNLLLILVILFFSCSRSAVGKKLAGCDSLVITFNPPNSDSVIQTVSTTETRAIQKLARFVDGKSSDMNKCGYDGNMIFFKGGKQVLPVVFRYTDPNCMHFLFDLDNKLESTRMSPEAVDFLESLSSGKNWY